MGRRCTTLHGLPVSSGGPWPESVAAPFRLVPRGAMPQRRCAAPDRCAADPRCAHRLADGGRRCNAATTSGDTSPGSSSTQRVAPPHLPACRGRPSSARDSQVGLIAFRASNRAALDPAGGRVVIESSEHGMVVLRPVEGRPLRVHVHDGRRSARGDAGFGARTLGRADAADGARAFLRRRISRADQIHRPFGALTATRSHERSRVDRRGGCGDRVRSVVVTWDRKGC